MALNTIRKATLRYCFLAKNVSSQRHYSLYDPDYLKEAESKIPVYPVLNVKIRGYNYPVLENYQSLIHKLAELMEININNSWALPAKVLKVKKYKEGFTTTNAEYDLNIYERNTQLEDVTSTEYPILIRIFEAALPEGVTLNIDIFDPELENKRYIPDKDLVNKKLLLEDYRQKKT